MRLFTLLCLLPVLLISQEMSEKSVAVEEIKGTLSTIDSDTNTAILIISGSGATDRNGNSPGYKNNCLKMVAHALTRNGYDVLRYDKRGVAESEEASENQSNIRFDNYVEDANNWIKFLDGHGYQNIVIIGHSLGSLVGILASIENEKVDLFISLSGLSEDAGKTISKQITKQLPALKTEVNQKLDSLRSGFIVKQYNPLLVSIFNPQTQPLLASYINYDPVAEISKLTIPALIINGSNDVQVTLEDAMRLHSGNSMANILIVDGMNHVLKTIPDGDIAANMASYYNPNLELSEGLVEGIVSFIQKF